MVTEFGMSAKLGAVKYGQKDPSPSARLRPPARLLGRHRRDIARDAHLHRGGADEAWRSWSSTDVLDDLVLE